MCHHRKPIELIARRESDREEETDEEETAETPTLTPPADD